MAQTGYSLVEIPGCLCSQQPIVFKMFLEILFRKKIKDRSKENGASHEKTLKGALIKALKIIFIDYY